MPPKNVSYVAAAGFLAAAIAGLSMYLLNLKKKNISSNDTQVNCPPVRSTEPNVPTDTIPLPKAKKFITSLLQQYLIEPDVEEVAYQLRKIRLSEFESSRLKSRHVVTVEVIKRAIYLLVDSDRKTIERLSYLIIELYFHSMLPSEALEDGIRRMIARDLHLDNPQIMERLTTFISILIANDVVCESFLKNHAVNVRIAEEENEDITDRQNAMLNFKMYRKAVSSTLLGQVPFQIAQIRTIYSEAIRSYIESGGGGLDGFIRVMVDMNSVWTNVELVKCILQSLVTGTSFEGEPLHNKCISIALVRELCATLLFELHANHRVSSFTIAAAFEATLLRLDDLKERYPAAPQVLGQAVARATVEGLLPNGWVRGRHVSTMGKYRSSVEPTPRKKAHPQMSASSIGTPAFGPAPVNKLSRVIAKREGNKWLHAAVAHSAEKAAQKLQGEQPPPFSLDETPGPTENPMASDESPGPFVDRTAAIGGEREGAASVDTAHPDWSRPVDTALTSISSSGRKPSSSASSTGRSDLSEEDRYDEDSTVFQALDSAKSYLPASIGQLEALPTVDDCRFLRGLWGWRGLNVSECRFGALRMAEDLLMDLVNGCACQNQSTGPLFTHTAATPTVVAIQKAAEVEGRPSHGSLSSMTGRGSFRPMHERRRNSLPNIASTSVSKDAASSTVLPCGHDPVQEYLRRLIHLGYGFQSDVAVHIRDAKDGKPSVPYEMAEVMHNEAIRALIACSIEAYLLEQGPKKEIVQEKIIDNIAHVIRRARELNILSEDHLFVGISRIIQMLQIEGFTHEQAMTLKPLAALLKKLKEDGYLPYGDEFFNNLPRSVKDIARDEDENLLETAEEEAAASCTVQGKPTSFLTALKDAIFV